MAAIGMTALGAFIGWIIAYVLYRISNWGDPISVLTGVISAAVAGAVFTFIKYLDEHGAPTAGAIYYYPVGLAYGAACNGLGWVAGSVDPNLRAPTFLLRIVHIAVVVLASVLILILLFRPDYLGIQSQGVAQPSGTVDGQRP